MKLPVLGGTGFIGPHVVRRLVAAGHGLTIAHTGTHEAELLESVRHLHTEGLRRGGRVPATYDAAAEDRALAELGR